MIFSVLIDCMYSPENWHSHWKRWLEDTFPFEMIPFQGENLFFLGELIKPPPKKSPVTYMKTHENPTIHVGKYTVPMGIRHGNVIHESTLVPGFNGTHFGSGGFPPIFWWTSGEDDTCLGTNISPPKACLKMIYLFPRWDMWSFPWRVSFPCSFGVYPTFFRKLIEGSYWV